MVVQHTARGRILEPFIKAGVGLLNATGPQLVDASLGALTTRPDQPVAI